MDKITVSFTYEKSTKNKVRFAEVDGNVVGSLYLDKGAFDELGKPMDIVIEIAEA